MFPKENNRNNKHILLPQDTKKKTQVERYANIYGKRKKKEKTL